MTALSIRHMNMTLARREQDSSMEPLLADREKSHYWFIERKSKAGRGKSDEWVFVRDFMGSKREAAELFVKNYRHSKLGKFRLVHRLTY